MIQLTVNGETKGVEDGASLTHVLEQFCRTGPALAVELNGEVIPRSKFAEIHLTNGDSLEIVTLAGGG